MNRGPHEGPERAAGSGRPSPPALFLAFLAGMTVLALMAPEWELLAPRYRTVGLVPVLGGALLHRLATARFRALRTTVEPDGFPRVLVQDGVFARTRNPMYLAGVVILAGVGLLLGAGPPLLAVPLWLVLSSRWFIRSEERALEGRFGEVYLSYRSRVGRWL